MAERFVDSFKTELIADGVWRTKSQLELAIVEWVSWSNHERLHEALEDRPPIESSPLREEVRFDPLSHFMKSGNH